jgi:hypothetical protein
MKLMLDIDIPKPSGTISYHDHILMMGSCFTGNVGKALQEAKFNVLYNPTGILFDPLSAARHLGDLLQKRKYSENDLFELNEIWSSWQHHSEFSSISKEQTSANINSAIQEGAAMLEKSTWIFITLGTAFYYQHTERNIPVTNCHKAPSSFFDKRLLGVEEIYEALSKPLDEIRARNKAINIVFTVSPVRHVRDGVIENNRSKARLIEAVHLLCEKYDRTIYFPAYELVIDVLRDHRFYENDLVHPNQLATQYVFDVFCKNYMDAATLSLIEEVKKLVIAKSHRPLHPGTKQHKQFLASHYNKTKELQSKLPMADWSDELKYFGQ